jgi:glycosyltransferase involved in cell wall biosynthesis
LKIIINTAHQRFGGAIQVALSFIHECRNFPEHEYHIWIGQGVEKFLDIRIFPPNFYFYSFNFGVINFAVSKQIQKTLRPSEIKIKPNVIISTSGPSYYHSLAPQIIGFNLPLYIYPESPFVKNLNWRRKLKLWLKKQAHYFYFKRDTVAFVVQTDDVRQRVKMALGSKNVFTVTNNHSNFYLDNNLIFPSKLPEKATNEFRFLTLTAYYPHKNLDIIKEIVPILRKSGWENVKFILTLKEEEFKKHFGNSPNIINLGSVKPQECPSLYRECDAMFLPTLAECFSASYPEAMIMRKPIVTTDLSFAKSICGDAALYFLPMNAIDAASKITDLVSSSDRQEKMVAKGLEELKKFDSPRQRAEKYLAICSRFAQDSIAGK